jgi:hypothetical protein
MNTFLIIIGIVAVLIVNRIMTNLVNSEINRQIRRDNIFLVHIFNKAYGKNQSQEDISEDQPQKNT